MILPLMAFLLGAAHADNDSTILTSQPCPIAPNLQRPTAKFYRKFYSCAATHYLDTDEGRAELTYELFSGLSGESWSLFTPKNHTEVSTSKTSIWTLAKKVKVEDCHGKVLAVLQTPVVIVDVMGQPVITFYIEDAAGDTVAVVRQMPWTWTQRHEVALCKGGPHSSQSKCKAGTTVLEINYPYAVSWTSQWDIETLHTEESPDPIYDLVTSVQVVSQLMIHLIDKDDRASSWCIDTIIIVAVLALLCCCFWCFICCMLKAGGEGLRDICRSLCKRCCKKSRSSEGTSLLPLGE